MDKTQRTTLLILAILGTLYFAAFWPLNAETYGSNNPIVYLDRDEYVTYPVVERMLAFEGDIHQIWGRLIVYGDYHYGYPFYFFSMLVLLPSRLLQGGNFFQQTAFNILLLRQFINVLPIILTAGALTYIHTRFKSLWKSLLIFALILTIPAVVRSNLHWWHPDSLMMLFIALTFLFLVLDNNRLGKYFYLAAAACGMASAIKMMGFFFFLTIPIYLLVTWQKEHLQFKKLLKAALLFVLVMAAVILLSNPFLFYKAPRDEMIAIQSYKTEELSGGYEHEESLYYSKGPQYWRWTLDVSYGKPWAIYFFMAAGIFGCFFGQNKELNWLLAAWEIPLGIYLMWFVSPKPDHYLLPLLLPLFSCALNFIYPLEEQWKNPNKWIRWSALGALLLFSLILFLQFNYQIARSMVTYLFY